MKSKVRYCDFCGEKLSPNDKFCKGCGNVGIKDKDAPDAIIDDPKGNNVSIPSNSNLALIFLAILAIIIVIILIV